MIPIIGRAEKNLLVIFDPQKAGAVERKLAYVARQAKPLEPAIPTQQP